MDEGREKQNNLLDTTDCLEAVAVFRGWKNTLFVIALLCLLFLQAAFWLVNTGCVKISDDTCSESAEVTADDTAKTDEIEEQTAGEQEIKEAAKQAAAAAPNQPTSTGPLTAEAEPEEPQQKKISLRFRLNITPVQLSRLIRISNFVLIPAAGLYCLTMLFSLKISLLGRLGGINHISRAFFISLIMVVLLLPWQRLFPGILAGAIYTPKELLTSCAHGDDCKIPGTALYYFRFTVLPLLVTLLLIFSQIRSARWAKAILRRLEVI